MSDKKELTADQKERRKLAQEKYRRTHRTLTVRLTDTEMELLNDRLKKTEMSKQEFLRKAILYRMLVPKQFCIKFMREIKAQGNNLNQIAHSCNKGYAAELIPQIKKVIGEIDTIWQSLKL